TGFRTLLFLRARSVSSSSIGLSSTSRITFSFTVATIDSLHLSECKVEGGARVDRSLGPHAPTVAPDDALYRGQTDAGALEFAGAVEALEDAEQLVRVVH